MLNEINNLKGYIYCYTNILNGKKYVGQTRYSLRQRAGKDGKGYNTQFKFGKAISKYGWDNFKCSVLEIIEEDTLEKLSSKLNIQERYWINKLNTYKEGYNCDLGGNSKIVSDHTKELLRKANLGKVSSEESKRKISEAQRGKSKTKGNYGVSRIGTHLSQEIKDKISATKRLRNLPSPRKGVHLSDETKTKLREAHLGKPAWNKGIKGINKMKTDQQLEKIRILVNKLLQADGINQKINTLKDYIDDYDVKYFLYFLYDPYVTTGLKMKKIEKDLPENAQSYNTLDCTFIELLKKLEINNTGSYKENYLVRQFIDKHNEFKDLIIKTVTKTLKLGMQATTINKAIPNCCRQFNVMLAFKYFDDPDKFVPDNTEFILTTKLDGVRCVLINDNEPIFYSRQGQVFEGLIELQEEANKLPKGYVYDGELLLDLKGLESKDLYRETMKVVSADKEKHNIIFNCFDLIPIESFKNGFYNCSAKERKAKLHSILSNNLYNYFKEVEVLYDGINKDYITDWLDKITSAGGEGIMINIANAPYECKRTKGLLKVKKMQTADVRVIDLEEGTGQNIGKLGAAIFKFIGPDGKIYENKVGSGFSKEQREYYWNHKYELLEKIIEISYFEISNNQNGTYGLRFPVFKHIRLDKDEISMY